LSRVCLAILVSFYYLEPFLKNQHLYQYRDWMMDSGAYSAYHSGKHITLAWDAEE
jgi:hypothetical protein